MEGHQGEERVGAPGVCKALTEQGLVNLKGKRLEIGVLLLPSTTCQVK